MLRNHLIEDTPQNPKRLQTLISLLKTNLSINLLLILTGILLFLPRLNLELKLDELGSFWVIKDSFKDVIERSLHLGQSPFYYLILWSFYKILGSSELALRLPSIIFILSSSLLMVRLGTLLFTREVGIFSAFTFVASIQAIVAATDARPYALGLFLTVLSTISLVEWCRKADKTWLLFYCLSLTATIYSHYLFGIIFIAHAIWAVLNIRENWKRLFKQAIWGGLCSVILLVPALYHVKVFSAKTAGKAFVKIPDLLALIVALVPLEFLLLLSLIIIFQITVWRRHKTPNVALFGLNIPKGSLSTLVSYLFLPVVIIYAISALSGNSIFLERYYAQKTLGLGLIGGILICSVTGNFRRVSLLLTMLVIITINQYSYGFSERAGDGFGKAAKRISTEDQSGQCQLLMMSGFIESQTISWLDAGLTRDFILSPLSYYKLSNPVTPIPYSFNTAEAEEYYSKVVRQVLEKARCVWLLYRNVELFVADKGLTPSPIALENDLLDNLGFRESSRTVHGFVEVIGYQ